MIYDGEGCGMEQLLGIVINKVVPDLLLKKRDHGWHALSKNISFIPFWELYISNECIIKNSSLRGHVLTGNECYTINTVCVIVDMFL